MTIAPHSELAELGVIGAAMEYPLALQHLVVEDGLTPEHFYIPDLQQVWRAILEVYDAGVPVDTVSVLARLSHLAGADDIVQSAFVEASAIGAVREHARIVKRDAMRRSWLTAGYHLIDACASDDEQLVAQAEQMLRAPTITEDTHGPSGIGDAAFDWLNDTGKVGISTGFPALDNYLGGGLRPGDMTALGAWTGIGKSCLVDQILTDAATAGLKCHAYINEMSVTDRALRMIARGSSVPFSALVKRDLNEGQAKQAVEASQQIPFGLTESAQWSAEQIARHIRANNWDLCALDVLHNMPYERESELHRMVGTLAAAARSSNTHLIVVCHFNEARATGDLLPRPVARDIRGSGMIKNLSANVLLLHRDQHSDGGFVVTENAGTLSIDKARHGQKGGVMVEFDPDRMRFWPAHVRKAA